MEVYPVKTYQLDKKEHTKVKKQKADYYLICKLANWSEKEIANDMNISVEQLYRFKNEWQLDHATDRKSMRERLRSIRSAKQHNIPHWQHKKPDLNK